MAIVEMKSNIFVEFSPQNYIITNFWIIIGLSILIGLMFTGIIIVYRLLSGSTTLGETLRQIITAALGLIVAAISVILVLDINLTGLML